MTSFEDDATLPAGDARLRPAAAPELLGARLALILACALLAIFVLVIASHWLREQSSTPLEIIVQQPVPADNAPPDKHPDVTAPDPGDNP